LASSVNLGDIGATAVAPAAAPGVTTSPEVANAPIQPSINVSGLSLSSVLNLGNLLQQTVDVQKRHTALP
jgi:hypothetical protein